MAAVEYKALTVVNLPFTETHWVPGQMIPFSAFEDSAEAAKAAIEDRRAVDENASPIPTAEEMVAALIEGGSLSEDEDAELHPDHIPRAPGELSVASVTESAKTLVAQLEAEGREVPEELRAMSEVDVRTISTSDKGSANDSTPKKKGGR
jgi:hypothetical protein